jgi:hypothetical protein
MKETEVRERIEFFLRSTIRQVVIPASLGVGLALIGCDDSKVVPVYGAIVPDTHEDASVSSRDSADAPADRLSLPDTKYMGPFPLDTSADRPLERDSADAAIDRLGLSETKYMGPFPLDTSADRPFERDSADAAIDRLGLTETKYMGPFPLDSGVDHPPYGPDAPIPQYAAPMLDAADASDPGQG